MNNLTPEMLAELEVKKKYLKRYKKNKALIDRLKIKVSILDERITSLRSPSLSGMPRGGNPVTAADLIAEKVDLEERIAKLSGRGLILKHEITDKIDELEESKYAEILESFFIDCKEFDEIAESMGYTERHVIRLYSEAILHITL